MKQGKSLSVSSVIKQFRRTQVVKVSRFLFAMITYNLSNLFRENTSNCKNGEEAHNETIRAYGAMGFLKLD